eukprot:1500622-Heterocapsa_arctica.AAC.1
MEPKRRAPAEVLPVRPAPSASRRVQRRCQPVPHRTASPRPFLLFPLGLLPAPTARHSAPSPRSGLPAA